MKQAVFIFFYHAIVNCSGHFLKCCINNLVQHVYLFKSSNKGDLLGYLDQTGMSHLLVHRPPSQI